MKTNVFLACLFSFLKTTAFTLICFWLMALLSNDIMDNIHGEEYLIAFFLTLVFYPPVVLVYVVAFLFPSYFIIKKKLPESGWHDVFTMLMPFAALIAGLLVFLVFITVRMREFTEPMMIINLINVFIMTYAGTAFFYRDIYKFSKQD